MGERGETTVGDYPEDIYTEPSDVDVQTLRKELMIVLESESDVIKAMEISPVHDDGRKISA